MIFSGVFYRFCWVNQNEFQTGFLVKNFWKGVGAFLHHFFLKNQSSFSSLQRSIAAFLSVLLLSQSGLLSASVYASQFETSLNEIEASSPEDLEEFGMVQVLVEGDLYDSSAVESVLDEYCERVQEVLGVVCVLTPWRGETASRIVESLQQVYFEGLEVSEGLATLTGLVIVGDVPLPIVHRGVESFPSVFPYVDLVNPGYVFDPDQQIFVSSIVDQPQAEIWHGLIRPKGEGDERVDELVRYFEKNEAFYAQDEQYSVVKEKIGFHDQYWENDSFDNETMRWYLKKLQYLERLMHFRFSGEWLQQLTGEAIDRLSLLSSQTFEDAPLTLSKPTQEELENDVGFNAQQTTIEANAATTLVESEETALDGELILPPDLKETVPDLFSAGPIRNLLKDYVNVVSRYVSGAGELLDVAGRRQYGETLPALITKMDKYHSSVLFLVGRALEQHILSQVDLLASDIELVSRFKLQHDYFTFEEFKYDSDEIPRFGNGFPINQLTEAQQCSLVRGSNFLSSDDEFGKAIVSNRKENPLTVQEDLVGVGGSDAKEELKEAYRNVGYCTYAEKDRCDPRFSKKPLYDYASSDRFVGENDFRRCFIGQGPPIPKDIENSSIQRFSSVIDHVEPSGDVVQNFLKQKLAHYLPIDSVRHVSFNWGGVGQYEDRQVGRFQYPNFFALESKDDQDVISQMRTLIEQKENELRKSRVEANWSRFERYLAYTTPVDGRQDYWNYNEIEGFHESFVEYREDVVRLLRNELDPSGQDEEYVVVEKYLKGQGSDALEQSVLEEVEKTFPQAFAKQDLGLECSYAYEIPPLDQDVQLPEVDPSTAIYDPPDLFIPTVNPPSIDRTCRDTIAKNTQDEVKTLKEFYDNKEGATVDIAILHNADKYVEILDLVAVKLFFTPPPPVVPPNTNMLIAIKLFDEQLKKAEQGTQPLTTFSQNVGPVDLVDVGELDTIVKQHEQLVIQALHWLNLSVESKHREGLSLLAEEKEMTYLVMNGDAERIDVSLPHLKGVFESDGSDLGVDRGVIREVAEREKALLRKQNEKLKQRTAESRKNGDKISKCGESVSLVEWPGAVTCWMDEMLAGPLLVFPGDEEEGESSKSKVQNSKNSNEGAAQIAISQKIFGLQDQVEALLDVEIGVPVRWESEGAVQVTAGRSGKAVVIGNEVGKGKVIAFYGDLLNEKRVSVDVEVVSRKLVVRQVGVADLKVGAEDTISFEVQVVDSDRVIVETSLEAQVIVSSGKTLEVPRNISIRDGKASFVVGADESAGVIAFRLEADGVAQSDLMLVNVLSGPPQQAEWDFGDGVIGRDGQIFGELQILDSFGNAYRGESLVVEIETEGFEGVGDDDSQNQQSTYFALGGVLSLQLNRLANSSVARVRVLGIEGFDEVRLPSVTSFVLGADAQLFLRNMPTEVQVGKELSFGIQVQADGEIVDFNNTSLEVQMEMGGQVTSLSAPFEGKTAFVNVPVGGRTGILRVSIDDENFGMISQEVELIGGKAVRLQITEFEYRDGELKADIFGADEFGNKVSLPENVLEIVLVGDLGKVLDQRNLAVKDGNIAYKNTLLDRPDRLLLKVSGDGFDEVTSTISLEQMLTKGQIQQLPWQTPYMVLGGAGFGDYRQVDSVAQAVLFGDQSAVQTITTEIVPHRGPEKILRIFPSGRFDLGFQVSASLVWENGQPVLVFQNPEHEIGRLYVSPRELDFSLFDGPVGSFEWSKEQYRGKSVVEPVNSVPDDFGNTDVLLKATDGRELMSFQNGKVTFFSNQIQAAVLDEGVDAVVFEFSIGATVLARWYVDVDVAKVAVDEVSPLLWRSSEPLGQYATEDFYAGESTLDEQGLVVLDQSQIVTYGLGKGRSALSDVYDNNGQGFGGQDKMALNYLAGNTVGESTLLQSEGIINLGDPVASLRQARHKDEFGQLIPVVKENRIFAAGDYSVGQLLYSPPNGTVRQVLRADIEMDGEDDLLVVVDEGSRSVVQYFEGQGEGYRWGKVSNLLDLGADVDQVEVVQNGSLFASYTTGQVVFFDLIDGKYLSRGLDFSSFMGSDLITQYQISDLDGDSRDDLVLLNGSHEVWALYGRDTSQGYAFGTEPDDRVLVNTLAVRIQDKSSFLSALWLQSNSNPEPQIGCIDTQEPSCRSELFRSSNVVFDDEDAALDRLEAFQKQADDIGFVPSEEVFVKQRSLVRVDQFANLRSQMKLDLLSHETSEQLSVGDVLQFELIYTPSLSDEIALQFDLGLGFDLNGSVVCDGCDTDLELVSPLDALWNLQGNVNAGEQITLSFSVLYQEGPDFSLQILKTNADEFGDIGVNVGSNQSAAITVFESRSTRTYEEIAFGITAAQNTAGSEPDVGKELSDLLRGVGVEGMSPEAIKSKILEKQQEVENDANGLIDDLYVDENGDGYPDVFQENPNLDPPMISTDRGNISRDDALDVLRDSFFKTFMPEVNAQTNNQNQIDLGLAGLANADLMLEGIESSVQGVVSILKCSRGCLPLPINFAFLAPGPINVFGEPTGFDPGLPVFAWGVPSLIPVWPPSPYQGSLGGRLYISPTLTAGLGIGICLGPWLLGQCFVFAVPPDKLGGEAVCDAAKAGLQNIVAGINQAIGQVNAFTQSVENEINSTGVIKASKPTTPPRDGESLIGIGIAGGIQPQGVTQMEPKVLLEPIPKIFVNWWDKQWEEVINSLTDLPDITVRLPYPENAFGITDADYREKFSSKVDSLTGKNVVNLQAVYDLVNSLPIVQLKPETVEIQIPWIEPGLLRRIEQSLYKFLYTFIIEFLAFVESFNLPCDIGVNRLDFFNALEDRMALAAPGKTREQIRVLIGALQDTQDKADTVEKRREVLDAFLKKNELDNDSGVLKNKAAYLQEFEEIVVKVSEVKKRKDEIDLAVSRLSDPSGIFTILPEFIGFTELVLKSWGENISQFDAVSESNASKNASAKALGQCAAKKLALNMSVNVTPLVSGIQKNIEALEVWKDFPRQLAKYLNIVEFYTAQIVNMIDQLTGTVLRWWSEFQKKLDLWIDAAFFYYEFVAMVKLLIDILKGYNKSCGLCTSDRLTLKSLLLKVLFGVVPNFPIIDFPSWPDVNLDFTDVQLGIDVTVPVFDVKAVELKWPELPEVKFPRFNDFDFKAGFNFSVVLPEVPLVIPSPPDLPPLQPLPNLPQINLPNLPPAPEVPRVLEQFLPIMQIIKTILDIWCLINKSLIPIPELSLKSQIENLTNRSGNLILPIDLMLELNLFPADLLSSAVPFDSIDVKSQFQTEAQVDLSGQLQETIDQQFHQPMNAFTQGIDQWINALRGTVQQGLGSYQEGFRQSIEGFQIPSASIQGGTSLDLKEEFPDLDFSDFEKPGQVQINSLRQLIPRPENKVGEVFAQRVEGLRSAQSQMKQDFLAYQSQISAWSQLDPNLMMAQLASGDYQLASTQQQIFDRVSSSYPASDEISEREIALVDKRVLLSQVQETRRNLDEVQQSLLGTSQLDSQTEGVVAVRNNQATRIQDYPLDDPVIQVWEDDILLAYEDALYLKPVDGRARRSLPYTGRVLEMSLTDLQRSKVHQLDVRPVSSVNVGPGKATLEWSWDSPGVSDVELTIWDSVGKAQRLDLDHQRFFLHMNESFVDEIFQSETAGFEIEIGQLVQSDQALQLSFGEDILSIPSGMQFRIPARGIRSLSLDGEGVVRLNRSSGVEWDMILGEQVQLVVSGDTDANAEGGQTVRVPALSRHPFIKTVNDEVVGLVRQRREILSGERLENTQFLATQATTLQAQEERLQMSLQAGDVFSAQAGETWTIMSGRGYSIVSEQLENRVLEAGFVILNGELVTGDVQVEEFGEVTRLYPQQEVAWFDVDESRFEVTLPVGQYYGRAREREGIRGFSPILHGSARQVFSGAQILDGQETISLPIYAPLKLSAAQYVIGNLPDESYQWDIEGENGVIIGSSLSYPGFTSVGDREVTLFVRNGDDQVVSKSLVIRVMYPELSIDEAVLQSSRVLRVQVDPSFAGVPIGVVAERDGVSDWFRQDITNGEVRGDRFLTNADGILEFAPLPEKRGHTIVIDEGREVATLYQNGRVVLLPDFIDTCNNTPLIDEEGYLSFRVSCLDQGLMVHKFDSTMIPHLDTDVGIVQTFTSLDSGVSVRKMQDALDVVALGEGSEFVRGGVQVLDVDDQVLMVIGPNGVIQSLDGPFDIATREFIDPEEPLVWRVERNGVLLVELRVKGDGDKVTIVDPKEGSPLKGDQDGDGILDQWELEYSVTDPNQDPDNDGLNNYQEFAQGTHPKKPDTDADGVLDGEEIEQGADPLDRKSGDQLVRFDDVNESNPYFESITRLAELGFIQGYGDGTFKPDQSVTRAEALKIIMSVIRCENCEKPSADTVEEFDPGLSGLDEFVAFHEGEFAVGSQELSAEERLKIFAFDKSVLEGKVDEIGTYFDVSSSDWFYFCVEIATQLGLVNGYKGFEDGVNALGSFIPSRGVNIAELMKVVTEAIGKGGKVSDRVYGSPDGWWNDPENNYLARAEEDLQLLIYEEDYANPLRTATRAEVAYAAYRVLTQNSEADLDEDGIANDGDKCPCLAEDFGDFDVADGCPDPESDQLFGPVLFDPRSLPELYSGIEITQMLECRCLAVVPADLLEGTVFYAVITGIETAVKEVLVKSQEVRYE
ncbi:MAG: S-layer homology domain-containing protein [Candidatus Gracilibacteria bacterium]|nr:S-layer homology domain-containing protein [Candidatus Gracilibacteria bacterium]